MRSPSGYGSIAKMSGKRRNPFRVQITTGWEFMKDEDGDPILDKNGEPKVKRIRKTMGYFPTRQAAMIALAEYNKTPYDLDVAAVTWLDVWNKWGVAAIENASKSLAPQLKRAHERCAPLYDLKMKDVRKGHMQDILDSISHMGGTSQARLKYVMQQNFKWALENDIITKDYSQFLSTDVKKKEESLHFPYAAEEIKKLWTHQDKLFPIAYSKQVIETTVQAVNAMLVLLYTGMRVMELGELKAADVYLDKRYIDLQGTKTSAAKRVIPIHKDIVPVIEALLADGGEYLVVNGHGLPLPYQTWKRINAIANDITGVKHTLHDTRHTFISAAERSGLDANSIILKRIVGHSTSGNTTALYTHKNIEDLLAAIDKISLI